MKSDIFISMTTPELDNFPSSTSLVPCAIPLCGHITAHRTNIAPTSATTIPSPPTRNIPALEVGAAGALATAEVAEAAAVEVVLTASASVGAAEREGAKEGAPATVVCTMTELAAAIALFVKRGLGLDMIREGKWDEP